jgi:toxin ParE1/3/4
MRGYKLTPRADRDVADILDYYAAVRGSIEAAFRVWDALDSALDGIGQMPESGHRRENLCPPGEVLRYISVFNYLIVYRPDTSPVEIVRIFHGARDVGSILTDEGDQG